MSVRYIVCKVRVHKRTRRRAGARRPGSFSASRPRLAQLGSRSAVASLAHADAAAARRLAHDGQAA